MPTPSPPRQRAPVPAGALRRPCHGSACATASRARFSPRSRWYCAANSAREALVKLTTLPLLAGENVSHRFILPTVAATIDLIVFLRADGWGHRRVDEVLAVSGRVEEDQVEAGLMFRRAGERLLWTGEYPPHAERFRAAGFDLVEVLAT